MPWISTYYTVANGKNPVGMYEKINWYFRPMPAERGKEFAEN
jgi:hypothetical protein